MTLRALIFDDEPAIRQLLWSLFDGRGYEVFTFPNPSSCPLCETTVCPCPLHESCADVILSDLHMPVKRGLDFLEEQIEKGCKCKSMALMSGDFSDKDIQKAASLGIKVFKKPFTLAEMIGWLETIEKDLEPNRKLSNWPLSQSKLCTSDDC
ncbi:MAG: response regulator [Desulfobacteraceae bacterium]|nr:MAG: response regulator [Desulfobacteraceae bacterium]